MRRQTNARLEQTLVAEARLAAELLAAAPPRPTDRRRTLDAEADRIGELLAARVTLIAADGRVLGDSSEPLGGGGGDGEPRRPARDDRAAARNGIGRAARHSDTLDIDMLYVAVPVQHPADRVRPPGAAAHRRPPATAGRS